MAFITVFYNPGWLLLLILMIIFGFRHPAPMDDQTPLDARRKWIGALAFLAFLLCAAHQASKRRESMPVAFGLLWFLIALLPTTIVPLGEIMADHRMFFPFLVSS
jgi:hypothetical protein